MTKEKLDLQPSLKGELVELRPLRRGDFDALYAVARDPLIWEQLGAVRAGTGADAGGRKSFFYRLSAADYRSGELGSGAAPRAG